MMPYFIKDNKETTQPHTGWHKKKRNEILFKEKLLYRVAQEKRKIMPDFYNNVWENERNCFPYQGVIKRRNELTGKFNKRADFRLSLKNNTRCHENNNDK